MRSFFFNGRQEIEKARANCWRLYFQNESQEGEFCYPSTKPNNGGVIIVLPL